MQLHSRIAALGLAALTVGAVACSSSKSSSSTSGSTAAPGTVASKLVLGAPVECQTNAYCVPGLEKTYGIKFKDFKPLGLSPYSALTKGDIDIAEGLSTDGQVGALGLVVLTDDKHLQSADDVVPVVRTDKATAGVKDVANKVSATLTTDDLVALNKSMDVDKQDPQAAADAWLKSKGLDTPSTSATGASLTIGGFKFTESDALSYIYGDALKAAGAKVTVKAELGPRPVLQAALQAGQGIDMIIEYAASALEFVDNKAGLASGDIANNVSHLSSLLQPKGVTVLTPSTAIDTNAFIVTKATATKYGLSTMSDLAKAAS